MITTNHYLITADYAIGKEEYTTNYPHDLEVNISDSAQVIYNKLKALVIEDIEKEKGLIIRIVNVCKL